LNEFGSFTNAEKDSDGAYGVQVLQLYTVDKYGRVTIAQSQLVQCSVPHTSVPESSTVVAAALMLLPLGVSALKIVRRKQAVQK
jgi:hypothetical protein